MNYLVTGAHGFSGRHLLAHLRARPGAVVQGVGRACAPGVDHACNWRDGRAVQALLEHERPDRIFHLVGSFANDWAADLAANVETTRVLLEAVRAAGLPSRILLVGSAAEYGELPPEPVPETTPLRPVSVYGLTKVLQTELMRFHQRRHGLHVVLARPFNLSGAGCPPALFPGHVEREVARVKAGVQSKVRVGDLSAERDYLPVADAVRAYVRILEYGVPGEAYHVASGRPVRMADFLADLLKPHGLSLEDVEQRPATAGAQPNVARAYADIRKLAALPA
jgi:GDP-4-dehydro-6-deoxy-D-mannose reductase